MNIMIFYESPNTLCFQLYKQYLILKCIVTKIFEFNTNCIIFCVRDKM